MKHSNYCVIMAGGIGSRFWPMSTPNKPKQFLDVLGIGKSLLQMTYDRLKKIAPEANIFILTNASYADLVKEQLPQISEKQILCEPVRKNTAPCIAYAAAKIKAIDPDATLVVSPSDHLIIQDQRFEEIINIAINSAEKHKSIVTLGIQPTRPDTGYGYIQWADAKEVDNDRVKKVKTFTEKPNLELAKDFIESGDFYWNSGIFVWNLPSIMKAFQSHLPEMYSQFEEGKGKYGTAEEMAFINNMYSSCENISIDYGIMEKAKNVNVVLSDFGWSDLGTWGSLHTQLSSDEHNNGVVGENVMLYNCADSVVHVGSEKLVVLHGLNGYIVVDTGVSLLVCKKEDEQKIKQFVNDIKLNKGESWV